ncbi:hypothetical protein LUZ60_017448 [Juncus effusus]|nr:hypothetical protein LUZ60_017448 [Juncus effusus]
MVVHTSGTETMSKGNVPIIFRVKPGRSRVSRVSRVVQTSCIETMGKMKITKQSFSSSFKMVNTSVMIGPWGSHTNTLHMTKSESVSLKSIVIKSGNIIDSIKYSYEEKDTENIVTVGPWGGSGGKSHQITFDDDEDYLVKMEGTYGYYDGTIAIHTLIFTTKRGKKYGPFGSKQGETHFSIPIKKGEIVGFFANAGTFVNAIGIYVQP